MVQQGKCDLCRLRKVKCDEGRPSCRVCSRGGRPCSYSFRDGNKSDGSSLQETKNDFVRNTSSLRLRSTRPAGLGRGVFHTFANQASPSLPISSDTTKLAGKWVHMVPYFPPGFYDKWLPLRLGTDPALDAAAAHTCDALRFFMRQNERNHEISQKSAAKAFKTLRLALDSPEGKVSDASFLSTILLLNTAYLRGCVSQNYISHALGLSRMLKMRWMSPDVKWGAVEDAAYFSIFIEEAGHAILAGTESEQDDPVLDQVIGPLIAKIKRSKLLDALITLVRHLYRVPRLLVKIRLLKDRPSDQKLLEDTIKLAETIYDSDTSKDIWELIEQSVTIKESTLNPLGCTVDYSKPDYYFVAVFFCHYRTVICGAIQTMFNQIDSPRLSEYFNRTEIEEEDLKAAVRIAMSTEYGFRPRSGPPFDALRIFTPLAISYGSWTRLLSRLGKDAESEKIGAHALQMQDFVFTSTLHITKLWLVKHLSRQQVERVNMAYVGGAPVLDFFKETRSQTGIFRQ